MCQSQIGPGSIYCQSLTQFSSFINSSATIKMARKQVRGPSLCSQIYCYNVQRFMLFSRRSAITHSKEKPYLADMQQVVVNTCTSFCESLHYKVEPQKCGKRMCVLTLLDLQHICYYTTLQMCTHFYLYFSWRCLHGHVPHMLSTKHDANSGYEKYAPTALTCAQ